MAKKKELSVADMVYLDNNRHIDLKILSKNTNVTLGVVRKYVQELPPESQEVEEEPEQRDVNKQDEDIVIDKEKDSQARTDHLYGRHKTRKGIVVSTPAASEMADATRHHRTGKSSKMEGMIHRCKPKN